MPELIAKTALEGRVPLTLGQTILEATDPGPVTSVALFPGQGKAAAKALKPLGLTFPAPNRMVGNDGLQLVWTGREQAFLIGGEAPDMTGIAAVTDQSGGWATLRLTGPAGADALARLVPLDLSEAAFGVGHAARAPLGHMQAVLMRPQAGVIEVMVFRSMAPTAWHEIEVALRALAARAALA